MIPIDVYVLSSYRDASSVKVFLDTFARGMEESAEEYLIPQNSESITHRFSNAFDLMGHLFENTKTPYSINYCQTDRKKNVISAMIFFTDDEKTIFGITVYLSDFSKTKDLLNEIATKVDGRYGYWSVETPPPLSSSRFIEAVNYASLPKLLPLGILD